MSETIQELIGRLEPISPTWAQRIRELDFNPLLIDVKPEFVSELMFPNRCIVGEAHGWSALPHIDNDDEEPPDYGCQDCSDFGSAFADSAVYEHDDYGDYVDTVLEPGDFFNTLGEFVEHFEQKHKRKHNAAG